MNGLLKKFIDFAMGNVLVLILGLLSSSIITRIITPDQNGIFSMFTTITSLIILVIMIGMDQSYVRYYHEESEENRGKLLRRCIKLPLTLNIILGLCMLIFYKPISNWLVNESSFFVTLLILIHSTFNIISNFVLINIRMKQRGKLYSFVTVTNKIFYLLFVWIFYGIFKNNYMTLILSFVLANICMAIVGMVMEKEDWFNFNSSGELNTDTKSLIKYGSPFIFSMAIVWVFQSIDKVSLKIFSDNYQIGLYAGAMTIIGLMNTLQGAFTTFWTPVAYEKYSKHPEDTNFFSEINQIVSLVMILLSIGLIACKEIIVLLLGPAYRETIFIFPFLVFMPIMYTISETTVLGINFKKKTKYHIYIAVFAAISNIIGNIILVPRMGATGAAISTGLSYIVFFLARTYFAGKLYKINLKMGRFWISIASVYVLAIAASLYTFNLTILILTIISIVIVLFMYRDILIKGYDMLKKVINKK
ncbi:oligosaccharide flippase family protein [Clostridium sp. NSJ-145]|uniref:lipopolysaccharide biosynthesis protein n=1 Tax=Clostridium sp. NSJ-145 TaxID=2897777 RepID=UPI001E4327AA|nr:oligosaccharide flippase family protein [Clostridium sp. NSJ-145]MCD2502378.1 oligosaccharide flippase family protein [Clostridium sp. NSJ-145]